jgi:hypothetical protein
MHKVQPDEGVQNDAFEKHGVQTTALNNPPFGRGQKLAFIIKRLNAEKSVTERKH